MARETSALNDSNFNLPWIVRGDLDGFFGLALDNLVQFIVISQLLTGIYGMPYSLVFGVIFPGMAISLLLGNVYFAWQARQVARATGRADVTAQPYGINTPSVYAFIFFIIGPVWAANRETLGNEGAVILAWHVCLAASFLSGIIELMGASIGSWVRKVTPRAALLSTLAGIAVSLISMPFIIQMFANPLISFAPLAIILLCYFGRVRLPGGFPGGLAAVLVGTILAWIGGVIDPAGVSDSINHLGFYLPTLMVGEVASAMDFSVLLNMVPVIVPMALINALGTLQNVEAAEVAGDSFPVASTMVVNGLGTMTGALFGSCFPTTVYIGHPGWKALGARSGYSAINGIVLTLLCVTGAIGVIVKLIPPQAAYPILLYIGMIMCSQAFSATETRHYPAVCIGLIPSIASWGLMLVGFTLTVAVGTGFDISIAEKFRQMLDFELPGLMNLSGGFLFSAMFLTAITVYFIDKNFKQVIIWCLIAAVFSWFGLIHSGKIVAGQFTSDVRPGAAWQFSAGYCIVALISLLFWILETGKKRKMQ